MTYLSGSEEKFVLAELILVGVSDESGHDILAGLPVVSLSDVARVAKDAVPHIEVVVGPARGIAGSGDAHRLEHSARAQLLHRPLVVETEGRLVIVGFDAADVVRVSTVQVLHQQVEGVSEGGPDCFLVRFLVAGAGARRTWFGLGGSGAQRLGSCSEVLNR